MSDPNGPTGADPSQPDSAPPPGAAPPPPPPQYASAPQAPGQQAGAGYGGVGKRFLARLIDYLLIGIPLGIILGIVGVRPGTFVYGIVTTVVLVGYFLFMETSKGGTFGKTWLGMSVADQGGSAPISMDASLRRNWWMLLNLVSGLGILTALAGIASLVIAIVIAVTISSDARKQGFHDKMANTFVVERATAPA